MVMTYEWSHGETQKNRHQLAQLMYYITLLCPNALWVHESTLTFVYCADYESIDKKARVDVQIPITEVC